MLRILAIAVFLTLTAATSAVAASTHWVEVNGGAVRLIAAGPPQNGDYKLGLEFQLQPGWHTYWRYPGEAGIPPHITTATSSNVGSIDILFPVPERYSDGFSTSIVYHDGIVLPIIVSAKEPATAVNVELDLFFGVCSDICVPGDAQLSLELTPDMKSDALARRLIDRDLSAVPEQAANGFVTVSRVADNTSSSIGQLAIKINTSDTEIIDVLAAGPDGSFIGLPQRLNAANGVETWHLALKGLKTTATDDKLRLVLRTPDGAYEHLEPILPEWMN